MELAIGAMQPFARWKGAVFGGITITSAIAVQIGYTLFLDVTRSSTILRRFNKGSLAEVRDYVNVRTQDDLNYARSFIIPVVGRKEYCIITGQRGLGKSVLVRVLAFQQPGVLVVNIPTTGDVNAIGRAIAEVIGFSFDEQHRFFSKLLSGVETPSSRDDSSMLDRCLHALAKAAQINQRKGKPPLVLVLDDLNRIKDNGVIEFLQQKAKFHADSGDLIFVFVMSEGSIPRKMSEQGDEARFDLFEVSEITKDAAKQFLNSSMNSSKLANPDFERLFEVTGGKIANLVKAANRLRDNNTAQEVDNLCRKMISNAEDSFSRANVIIIAQHPQVWAAVKKILAADTKSISFDEFVTTIGSEEQAKQILATNVFAHHYTSRCVSMQSAAHEQYAKSKLLNNNL